MKKIRRMRTQSRSGWILAHPGGTYIGSDGSFAFYTKNRNEAHVFETEEAALKHKGTFLTEYEAIKATIEHPERIPSFVIPRPEGV